MSESGRCKRCGACKECGVPRPGGTWVYPYATYPYPYYLSYPGPYWQSGGQTGWNYSTGGTSV